MNRDLLQEWLVAALRALGGSATVVEVYRRIREDREQGLRSSGDLFYTWPYDVRWAATKLRKAGRLAGSGPGEPWRLAR